MKKLFIQVSFKPDKVGHTASYIIMLTEKIIVIMFFFVTVSDSSKHKNTYAIDAVNVDFLTLNMNFFVKTTFARSQPKVSYMRSFIFGGRVYQHHCALISLSALPVKIVAYSLSGRSAVFSHPGIPIDLWLTLW